MHAVVPANVLSMLVTFQFPLFAQWGGCCQPEYVTYWAVQIPVPTDKYVSENYSYTQDPQIYEAT